MVFIFQVLKNTWEITFKYIIAIQLIKFLSQYSGPCTNIRVIVQL